MCLETWVPGGCASRMIGALKPIDVHISRVVVPFFPLSTARADLPGSCRAGYDPGASQFCPIAVNTSKPKPSLFEEQALRLVVEGTVSETGRAR